MFIPVFIVLTKYNGLSFLVFNFSLQETDCLEIVLLRDVRTGKSAKVPKVCINVIRKYSVYFVAKPVELR